MDDILAFLTNGSTITAQDVHDIGMAIFKASETATSFDISTGTTILNIIDIVSKQPIRVLIDYGEMEKQDNADVKDYLLWYPCVIPYLVTKSKTNFTYQSPSMFVKSMEAEELCKGAEDEMKLCFDGANQVSSTSDTSICSEISLKDNVCNQNMTRLYVSMISATFSILGTKNTMNLDAIDNLNSSHPMTYKTVSRCKCNNVLQSSYTVGTGAVSDSKEPTSWNFMITAYHSKTVNDLHRQPYIGQFINTVLTKGPRMSRLSQSYQETCRSTTCVVYYTGCSSDPVVCSTGFHIVAGILFGLSVIIVIYFISASEVKNAEFFFKCMPNWFIAFFISDTQGRLRRFSFLYSTTVLIFNAFVLFLGDNQVFNNDTSCETMAIIHYFLFLSIFFIVIENTFILTNTVGGWNSWYSSIIYILSGLDNQVVRGIYSFVIPFFLTGIFGLTMVDFFKRNDDFCWVRSDYKFPSLWLPLILFIISFIFYIPLIARSYRNNIISKYINNVFAENSDPVSIDEEKGGNYLISRVISWLFVPQFILVLAMIFENETLYRTEFGGWHLLFIIFIYIQITFYYSISFIIVVLFRRLKSDQMTHNDSDDSLSNSSTIPQPSVPESDSEPIFTSPPRPPPPRKNLNTWHPYLFDGKHKESQTTKSNSSYLSIAM